MLPFESNEHDRLCEHRAILHDVGLMVGFSLSNLQEAANPLWTWQIRLWEHCIQWMQPISTFNSSSHHTRKISQVCKVRIYNIGKGWLNFVMDMLPTLMLKMLKARDTTRCDAWKLRSSLRILHWSSRGSLKTLLPYSVMNYKRTGVVYAPSTTTEDYLIF